MLELAATLPASTAAEHYRTYAFGILSTLLGPEFLANETPGWEGLLKHGTYHERKRLGVDESVIWGEYFFLSAIDKALSQTGQ
jgi:unsaturated chondroitin disaccharide hydrolase